MNARHHLTLFAADLLLASGTGLSAAGHYVDVNSTNATPPYTNWTTAATNIQDAVDAAVAGDEVLVTNGTYQPIGVGKPLSVRSINGPQFTVISGVYAARCVDLNTGVSLSGFTLTQGTAYTGGGAYQCTLNNCTLSHNSAAIGGAAYE